MRMSQALKLTKSQCLADTSKDACAGGLPELHGYSAVKLRFLAMVMKMVFCSAAFQII